MQEFLQILLTYLRGMWRYRWYAMGLTWLIVSVGWLYVYKLPDVYEVSASVHVNTESLLRPLLRGLVIEPNIDQRLSILSRTLKSQENMEKLAEISEIQINKDVPRDIKISIDDLANNITLTSSKTAQDIYTISYQNKDPNIAKVVVESLLKIIIENTLKSSGDDEEYASKFLKEQLANYEAKLIKAENRLKEFKKKNSELMPNLGKGYFENLQNVRETLANAELELDEAIKRRDELKRQIKGEDPVFGFAPSSAEKAISHPLDTQIQELQKQLNELLLQYTDLHPRVIALKESIENLEKIKRQDLASQPRTKNTQPILETNPVFQQLSVALSEAEAQVASLRVRVNEYKQREQKLQKMVDTIPQFEAELTRLNRDYDTQRKNYEDMQGRYATAQISSEVEQTGNTVKFEVLEPPSVPQSPSGPNRLKLNGLILVLGIGAAIGLAFVLSELTPVVYDAKILNDITGLPIFGAVSKIVSQEIKKKEYIEYGGYTSAFMLLLATFAGTSFL